MKRSQRVIGLMVGALWLAAGCGGGKAGDTKDLSGSGRFLAGDICIDTGTDCPTILKDGMPVPATYDQDFVNAEDDQANVSVKLKQNPAGSGDVRELGKVTIPFLKPGKAGTAKVGVKFEVTAEGRMKVMGRYPGGRTITREIEVPIRLRGTGVPESGFLWEAASDKPKVEEGTPLKSADADAGKAK